MDAKLIDETISRLKSLPGVVGVLIANAEGVPIRTTLDPALAVQAAQYAALALSVATTSRYAVQQLGRATYDKTIADADPKPKSAADGQPDDLQFVRLRSLKDELLIAPDVTHNGKGLLLVVAHRSCTI